MNDIRALARTVDERLCELSWARMVLGLDAEHARDNVRRAAGQRTVHLGHGLGWDWNGTFDEAWNAEPEQDWKRDALDEARAKVLVIKDKSTQVGIEIAELNEVYREHHWNRAFLVKNANGHVHSSQHCSTCFDSTQFAWLTEYSGAVEAEIVDDAGEIACTVCYPSAPAEVLNRPSRIVNEEKAAKDAARIEREAKRIEREAKRKAAAATASGEPLVLPDDWYPDRVERINTERTARMEWNSAQNSLVWEGQRADRLSVLLGRQSLIESALAEKHGITPEQMREQLLTKHSKRRSA